LQTVVTIVVMERFRFIFELAIFLISA